MKYYDSIRFDLSQLELIGNINASQVAFYGSITCINEKVRFDQDNGRCFMLKLI